MPRYFFHVRDGQEYLDTEGSELESLEAARLQSLQVATQLLSGLGSEFWNGQDWHLHVEDEVGKELFCLYFHAAIKFTPH